MQNLIFNPLFPPRVHFVPPGKQVQLGKECPTNCSSADRREVRQRSQNLLEIHWNLINCSHVIMNETRGNYHTSLIFASFPRWILNNNLALGLGLSLNLTCDFLIFKTFSFLYMHMLDFIKIVYFCGFNNLPTRLRPLGTARQSASQAVPARPSWSWARCWLSATATCDM